MCALSDDVGRGRTLGQLGLIARERFDEALAAKRSPEEAAPHLVKAIQFYEQALEMFPKTAVTDRGIAHHQLGVNYRVAGNVERALYHYRQDIRYCEEAGDTYGAGHGRRSAALALLHAGRLDDARAYAEAALANFNFFGERAAEDVEGAQQLMTLIDQAIAKKGGSS